MRTTPLGTTGIELSALTLGTMTFGTPVGEDEAVRLTHAARDLGITSIDTANMYEGYARTAGSSGGVAEEIVGAAIAHDRSAYVVATKLGMKVGDGPDDENTSPSAIRTQLRRSLTRLGTDHVDIYYLHRPDPVVETTEIVSALGEELRAGTIRSYGVSNHSAAELRAVIDAADAVGVARPAVVQPKLNLLDRSAEAELLPLCAREGIAVLPYQVLEGGVLSGKYRGGAVPAGSRAAQKPEWIRTLDESAARTLEEITLAADAEGLTMAQYAFVQVLRMPAVVSALVGATRLDQLEQIAAAVHDEVVIR
ncbi:aldo/keto reductase [Microbacterium sp. NPDC058342]|uniref:aldo/keto reductase n=1 Tax=Microbacterium sp. NPDC058342 TaxID=3346454 RepID=UPI003657FA06